MEYIVTHPGAAHRDDLLSVAIALAHYGCVPVFRRDPTEEELENPRVLVLDTGGRHEPGRLNFDHHQLPQDAEPTCAFALLVRHFGLESQFMLQDWYAMTSLLDSKGPFVAAKSLGMNQLPEELSSPVERVLLDMFGDKKCIPKDSGAFVDGWELIHPFLDMLRIFGATLLKNVEEYAKAYSRVRETARVVEVDDLKAFLVQEALSPTLGAVLSKYRNREHPDVAVSVTASDRDGESWALYRYDDHPRVDFSRLSGDRVVFAHAGGFIAKLAPSVDEGEALSFVKAALV